MTATGPHQRLLAALTASKAGATTPLIGGLPIALGWATVELERAANELAADLGIAAERFLEAPDTGSLGAHCRIAREILQERVSVALLEPSTEGRLAATLARSGEGPAAVWLAVGDLPAALATLRLAGLDAATARTGPFGVERLLLGEPIYGPHRLLVELAGTIRS